MSFKCFGINVLLQIDWFCQVILLTRYDCNTNKMAISITYHWQSMLDISKETSLGSLFLKMILWSHKEMMFSSKISKREYFSRVWSEDGFIYWLKINQAFDLLCHSFHVCRPISKNHNVDVLKRVFYGFFDGLIFLKGGPQNNFEFEPWHLEFGLVFNLPYELWALLANDIGEIKWLSFGKRGVF